jgi:hypothetical protein
MSDNSQFINWIGVYGNHRCSIGPLSPWRKGDRWRSGRQSLFFPTVFSPSAVVWPGSYTVPGNVGSVVHRCSTFIRIKRSFGYTQRLIGDARLPESGRLLTRVRPVLIKKPAGGWLNLERPKVPQADNGDGEIPLRYRPRVSQPSLQLLSLLRAKGIWLSKPAMLETDFSAEVLGCTRWKLKASSQAS